jgi:hypothetical protein
VIVEEAERQAREAERTRYRYNELMTLGYERAMEWLEGAERSDLRFQDVLNITRLYMDYLKSFDTAPESRDVDDWEEDDGDEIVREIDARPYLEHPGLGLEDWEGSEEGSGEDRSEESEGEEP